MSLEPRLTGEDVERLVDLAGRGERAAVDELIRRYAPRIEAFVRREMGAQARRWAEPEDIVQQAFLETVGRVDRLPAGAGEDELLRRLFQTARSRIKDVVRNRGRDLGESVLPMGSEAVRELSTAGPVTRADSTRLLRELVERLPGRYSEVVRLCAFEGLSFAAAGERLGLEPEAVRKRYERARDALARKIAERRNG